MGWENIPPNTCTIDDPVLPAVELLDQNGRIINVIVASMCDAEWLCIAYVELGMYEAEGVTAMTCRPRPDVADPDVPPPTEFPPPGDMPPQPDPDPGWLESPEPEAEEE